MTQIGKPIPRKAKKIRTILNQYLSEKDFKSIDAGNDITGKDFLDKIWDMILSVQIGVAIVTEEMSPKTLCNIYYELGLMQAMGKETVVIKTPNAEVPTDFIRTEYIELSSGLKSDINKFFDKLNEQAEHYAVMATELEQNPVLAVDYLRRAYLITSKPEYKNKAVETIINCSNLGKQSHNIVKDFIMH
jgi:hypothetical protein